MRRSIGTMHIANASQLADASDYWVFAKQSGNPLTGEPAGVAEFKVRAHARKQPVWALVQRTCEETMTAEWTER
ncbi:hypothetical protein ACVWW4_003499 [Bradyrhizobium sp. LB7.1]